MLWYGREVWLENFHQGVSKLKPTSKPENCVSFHVLCNTWATRKQSPISHPWRSCCTVSIPGGDVTFLASNCTLCIDGRILFRLPWCRGRSRGWCLSVYHAVSHADYRGSPFRIQPALALAPRIQQSRLTCCLPIEQGVTVFRGMEQSLTVSRVTCSLVGSSNLTPPCVWLQSSAVDDE